MFSLNSLFLSVLTLFLPFLLLGQGKPANQDLELVKIASLNTIDANKEFQKNVQLVQQQRALAVQILSKIEKTQDKEEHDKLQKQLDSLQKKLNDNNQLMFKTYGFTLNRNYVLTVEKAHVHMWVTKDEAASINAKNGSTEEKKSEGLRSLFKNKK
jgi:hypothetical protein